MKGPGDTAVRLQRVFDADIEHLFRCFTDPSLVMGWWGPIGTTCPDARADLRVGGNYEFQILDPDSGKVTAACGEYVEIDAPNRLVFTWSWAGEADEVTLVTLNLRALDGPRRRTELELIHERFPDADRAARHSHGWNSSLDGLTEFIANERSG